MKTHIKTMISVMLISLISTFAKAADIKISELNWQSGSLIAYIDSYIIKHGYGHDTEIVPGGIDATIESMLATGSPNIVGEMWISSLGDNALSALNDGTLISVTDDNGVIIGAGEGWFIPKDVAEKNGLNTIEDVLARPDLFPHPEDSSKGGIVICPEGWSCKQTNLNLFEAFDMEAKGWKVLEPGSATGLNAHWEGSVTKGQGAFGYYWTPTSFVGRLNLVGPLSAEVGFAGDDNWTKCIASQTDELCADAQPSQWPSSKTGTIVTPGLDQAVNDYVSARSFEGSVITSMLVWMDANQATAEDSALHFLNTYPEVWTKWVTPEAATNITASLN